MDERARKVGTDIEEFGWHVVCVPEDKQGPSYAYSIGFQTTLSHPEVVILGLELNLMHQLINDIGNHIKSGRRHLSGQRYPEILRGYDCLFVNVEEKFFSDYFGQALDYHQGRGLRILQCQWPDKQGVFPNDPECSEGVRAKQSLDPTAHAAAPKHSHGIRPDEWPFRDPENSVAFSTTQVMRENHPVLLVSHDEEGDWQILCGTTNDTDDLLVVCLGCAFKRDRTIGELADLPLGWRAFRENISSPWVREASPKE